MRPDVALQFELRGPDYERRLRQHRLQARQDLQDTLRAILQTGFGFLNWTASPVRDTVLIELFQQRAVPQHGCLRVSLRGTLTLPDTSMCPVVFEKWIEIMSRVDSMQWEPDTLRRKWGGRLESVLRTVAGQLVEDRLGRLPLNAHVELTLASLQALQAHLAVRPNDINAAPDPRGLEFRLRVVLRDPRPPNPTIDRNAELWFGRCLPHATEDDYVCDITVVIHKGDTLKAGDQGVRELLLRARFDSLRLHLKRYQPATIALGAGGLVGPAEGPR